MNFARLLFDAADRHPDRPLLHSADGVATYGTIARRSIAIAGALRARGVDRGDRIAILGPDDADVVSALFAIWAIGAVSVHVSPNATARQVRHIIGDAEPFLLLASDAAAVALAGAEAAGRPVSTIAEMALRGEVLAAALQIDDEAHLAQLIYTSGSTGLPKGVMTGHAALWAGVRTVTDYLGLHEHDRIASVLPFGFVYGLSQLTCAIACGASLVIARHVLAGEQLAALRAAEVTVLTGVPPHWLQWLRFPGFDGELLPRLRLLTCAGGRLAPAAVTALRRAFPNARLFLMYGLTEVFRSTFLPPDEVDAHPDSMGYAVPGARVYVLRDDGSEADVGETGELAHAGPTVADGYWRAPEATARVFRPNPVDRTAIVPFDRVVMSGDLVRRDAEGRLYYVGRRDRQIKSLGHRISPDEVADVLLASGACTDALVAGEPDPVRGECVVAYVVLARPDALPALRAYAARELPRHMVPARYELCDVLPRTANGKHDVATLLAERRGRSTTPTTMTP
jgi:amino acid adenylation domain-containing protein